MTEKKKPDVPLIPQEKLHLATPADVDSARRDVFKGLEDADLPPHVIPGENEKLSDDAPPVAGLRRQRFQEPPVVSAIPEQGEMPEPEPVEDDVHQEGGDGPAEAAQAPSEQETPADGAEKAGAQAAEPETADPERAAALAEAKVHLAYARIDPEAQGFSEEQILAVGASVKEDRNSRDRILQENAALRRKVESEPATEPISGAPASEPGRPPETPPPAAPPADLASQVEPLLEPLGLDADAGKAVGQVIQQIVAAATAPLIQEVKDLRGGVNEMVGRTLHTEVGNRFPGIRDDAAKLEQVVGLASANQEQFTTFEEALDFAHRGLGFEAAATPAPEDPKPRLKKTSSTAPKQRGQAQPLSRDQARRAVFESL